MPRAGAITETRIAPGIVRLTRGRTVLGFRAFVRVRGPQCPQGRLASKRFAPDTSIKDLKAWREDQRTDARKATAPTAQTLASVGGFSADADRYLKAVAAMTSIADRTRDVLAWAAVFGGRQRSTITAADVAAQLAIWRKTLSAASVNHRRTALMHLWRVLDGRSAANPVRETRKSREPDALPRGVPYEIVRRMLNRLAPSKSRARLKVMAFTGLPHAQIETLALADIDLTRRTLIIHGRKKGTGTPARAVPLGAEGVEALEEFIAAEAWGHFSRGGLRKAFMEARRKEIAATPTTRAALESMRPYDLRHSFGTAVYAATGDIRATQVLMGHSRVEMTQRYTLGAVDARLTAAVAALDAEAPKKPKRRKQSPPAVTTRRVS